MAEEFIPRKQAKMPGPALSPEEALKKFQVHDGFHVELVAAEPDLLNPVAMAFDDRGRIYVTESFEYPRREAGPGRDRIKILEDTNQDGRVDSVKVFAEGLNIPSGIAVGHGGVWVANAPDLLFLEDTDGDDKADKQTVVVTGFGRDDTHELPNALTWGPDGCLYGLNGVFNRSVIEQDGRIFDFTCTMFRIDPRTRKFDLFCEGTSNPWGIAFDLEGSPFISACVIDHLWHLTESAYYHRQGGPYPPHTWKAESIVKHKHQMAAYCGIEWFDSFAYPAAYREKLYMGNIHGSCVNVDRVQRTGATYEGFPEKDFITADDVWFMPVAQKVGPDGCLYILDWYDRYHCYQDANADPKGVDRGKGRLYRVVYDKRPPVKVKDFAKLDNPSLVTLLRDENIYNRRQAQLELAERQVVTSDTKTRDQLITITNDSKASIKLRMHAVWSLVSSGPVDEATLAKWFASSEPLIRSWAVRTAGRQSMKSVAIRDQVKKLAADADPRVRIEVAIAARKIFDDQTTAVLIDVLHNSSDDPILPKVVWQNLMPNLSKDYQQIVNAVKASDVKKDRLLVDLTPRIASVLTAFVKPGLDTDQDKGTIDSILDLAETLNAKKLSGQASSILDAVISKAQNGEIRGDVLAKIAKANLARFDNESGKTLGATLERWKVLAGDEAALKRAEAAILDSKLSVDDRKASLRTVAIHSSQAVSNVLRTVIDDLVANKPVDGSFRDTVFDLGISRATQDDISKIVASLPKIDGGVQATIAERMSQRTPTAQALLDMIIAGQLRKELVSPNQVRSLAQNPDDNIKASVKKIWGNVNTTISQQRQKVVTEYGNFLRWDGRGDAKKGLVVFDRICGQCHVMHGRGYEVGPNITSNGRGNFEQLIVSVFDPSLVIGEAYKSLTVLTKDGTVFTGLLVEQTPQKVVLRLQGNKLQTIPEEEIEEIKQNEKSLMPEGIEEQMTRQEMADLFALLSLEGPYDSEKNSTISGTPPNLHKK